MQVTYSTDEFLEYLNEGREVKRKRKFFGKRALLNLPGEQGTAAIVAEIEDTSNWKPGTDCYGEPLKSKWRAKPQWTLSVSDCSRSIDLSIDLDSEREYENSLHKLDTIIDAVAGLRQGLVIERGRYLERIKELPKESSDD